MKKNKEKGVKNIISSYKGVFVKGNNFPKFFNETIEKDIFDMFYYQKPHALNIMLLLYNVKIPFYKLRLLYKSAGTTAGYTTNTLHELKRLNLVIVTKKEGQLNTHIELTQKGKDLMDKWMKAIKTENKELLKKEMNKNGN